MPLSDGDLGEAGIRERALKQRNWGIWQLETTNELLALQISEEIGHFGWLQIIGIRAAH